MTAGLIWIRQGERVEGPYPARQVVDWMIAGQIGPAMLLSADRLNWMDADRAWHVLLSGGAESDLGLPPPAPPPMPVPRGAPRQAPTSGRGVHSAHTGRATGRDAPRHGRHGRAAAPRIPTPVLVAAGFGVLAVLGLVVAIAAGAFGGKAPEAPPAVVAKKPPPKTPATAPAAPTGPLSTAEIVKRSEGSVALLKDSLCSGTGFLVEEGILVTCAHVVRPMLTARVTVRFPSGGSTPVGVRRILHLDDDDDVCLLELRSAGAGRPLALAATKTLERGLEVVVIGSPGLSDDIVIENAISRGLLGPEVTILGRTVRQVSASVNPGNSGGPVLAPDGTAVGMVTAKATEQEGMAFAVPAAVLRAALAHARSATEADLRRIHEVQTASALVIRLETMGNEYEAAMLTYIGGLRRALGAGVTTVREAERYVPNLKEVLAPLEKRVGSEVPVYEDLIRTTPWSDRTLSEALDEYFHVIMTLRTRAYANEVVAILVDLERSEKALDSFRKQTDALRARLGIPEDE